MEGRGRDPRPRDDTVAGLCSAHCVSSEVGGGEKGFSQLLALLDWACAQSWVHQGCDPVGPPQCRTAVAGESEEGRVVPAGRGSSCIPHC